MKKSQSKQPKIYCKTSPKFAGQKKIDWLDDKLSFDTEIVSKA